MNQDCIIVDLETTGASNTHNRIIEFAGLSVNTDGTMSSHEQLIQPGMSLSPFIVKLTGITDDMLSQQPVFTDVAEELYRLLKDRLFIAHNARFDIGFLRRQFEACGIYFNPRVICTVKLARKLFPDWPRHNLDTVNEKTGYLCENRHRAMADVNAVKAFIDYAINSHGLEAVNAACEQQLQNPNLPRNLSSDMVDSIPNTVGVYRFYNQDGQLLYVGKSKQLRTRILSHFQGNEKKGKTPAMTDSIHDIDYTITAGELGALLLENQQIKTLSPIYNRRQRKHGKLWCFVVETDKRGYDYVSLQSRLQENWQQSQKVYGLFRSKKAASSWLEKLLADNALCKKVNQLEKGPGRCFARQLKKCKGACEEAETSLVYNMRLHACLESVCVEPWPHDGPVIHYEHNHEFDIHEAIVINRWGWVKTLRIAEDDNPDPQVFSGLPVHFDADTYNLIRRHMNPVYQ